MAATTNGTKTAAESAADATPKGLIKLQAISEETLLVPIVGLTPLIVNQFSAKAKQQMLASMQGRTVEKEPKNPDAEYERAFYRLNDGTPGMVAGAFKDATVGGARFYSGVTMTALKTYLRFLGEIGQDGRMMVRVEGEPRMREDVARVGRGGTDLRYRPEFYPWRAALTVVYPTGAITRESVLALIEAGGRGIGVGDWRPQRGGEFGTYTIDPDRTVEVL